MSTYSTDKPAEPDEDRLTRKNVVDFATWWMDERDGKRSEAAIRAEVETALGGDLAEQIRTILKPEWLDGRILPAYVGSSEHARLNAIEALVNVSEEQS